MTGPSATRKPTFFWQGTLILLPLMVMAGIAFTAIVQDRATAEREARHRAQEAIQQIGDGFERRLGSELTSGTRWMQLWRHQHLLEEMLWPGSQWRRECEKERTTLAAEYAKAEALIEEVASRVDLAPDDVLPADLSFLANTSVAEPGSRARFPQPPKWRAELTPEQLTAWDALNTLPDSADAGQFKAATEAFGETGVTLDALANAEFVRLRATLKSQPASNAIPQWLEFAARQSGTIEPGGLMVWRGDPEHVAFTESGIPLSNLAVAKALQSARDTGASEELWTALVREINWLPSAFTPALLDLAEPVIHNQPELQPCLRALRRRWASTERAWDMADVIRERGQLKGITTTNLWLNFQGIRWLCLLQPGCTRTYTSSGGQPTTFTNSFTEAHLYPKPAIEQAFLRALAYTKAGLPPYLALTADLEAEPLALGTTPLGGALGERAPPGRALSASAPYPYAPLLAHVEGRLSSVTAMLNARVPDNRREFESLPGRPAFSVRIVLADQALLFAAQRHRIWLFGGLVLAAAFTATVGFLAAWRSFHRQLRLSEMKSNFVSSVSHEIRAPIASVRLMAESLERGKVAEAAKQHEYFRFIVQECRRLSSLIENVLDVSRIEQGRKQYEFDSTDLMGLTEKTVRLMETYAAEREIKFQLLLPETHHLNGPLQTLADGKALQQALINLIDNAIKHSPKHATILVGLELSDGKEIPLQQPGTGGAEIETVAVPQPRTRTIRLWVEDHGEGIPAAEHEKIFERFYRRGSELRRETQGVGIGLSIVKHVVEAHGGRVLVRSVVGQGSRFTIELPQVNRREVEKSETQ
jgi:signal transduction histidine kinase